MDIYLKKLITIKKTPIKNKIIQKIFSTQLSLQLPYFEGGHMKIAKIKVAPIKASLIFIALDLFTHTIQNRILK